jgi:hypothetical protein
MPLLNLNHTKTSCNNNTGSKLKQPLSPPPPPQPPTQTLPQTLLSLTPSPSPTNRLRRFRRQRRHSCQRCRGNNKSDYKSAEAIESDAADNKKIDADKELGGKKQKKRKKK